MDDGLLPCRSGGLQCPLNPHQLNLFLHYPSLFISSQSFITRRPLVGGEIFFVFTIRAKSLDNTRIPHDQPCSYKLRGGMCRFCINNNRSDISTVVWHRCSLLTELSRMLLPGCEPRWSLSPKRSVPVLIRNQKTNVQWKILPLLFKYASLAYCSSSSARE